MRGTSANGGAKAVNARDRIGTGPWYNAKGELIANNVADLHGDVERDRNNLHKQTALNEKGEVVSGRGDQPNRHDILTGTSSDGRVISGDQDTTCGNLTSSKEGGAIVGHHDRNGGGNTSWNAAHRSRGCGQTICATPEATACSIASQSVEIAHPPASGVPAR